MLGRLDFFEPERSQREQPGQGPVSAEGASKLFKQQGSCAIIVNPLLADMILLRDPAHQHKCFRREQQIATVFLQALVQRMANDPKVLAIVQARMQKQVQLCQTCMSHPNVFGCALLAQDILGCSRHEQSVRYCKLNGH